MSPVETNIRTLLATPQTTKTVLLTLRKWYPKAAGRKRAVRTVKAMTTRYKDASSGEMMMVLKE
jgi:hypothetical protein